MSNKVSPAVGPKKNDREKILACVQTSPLPQKKSEEETSPLPIFPEGGGTSVHRLRKYEIGKKGGKVNKERT